MFGLIFIYFIGKQFYRLAETYDKNRWVYAILAIVCYYFFSIISLVLISVFSEIFNLGWFDGFSDRMLGLIGLPFGILACVAFHWFLDKKWKKQQLLEESEIDQIGLD